MSKPTPGLNARNLIACRDIAERLRSSGALVQAAESASLTSADALLAPFIEQAWWVGFNAGFEEGVQSVPEGRLDP